MKNLSMNWIDGKCQSPVECQWWLSIRFWEIPPFWTDGIRRVTTNHSELKKMTARDYEDMLQVSDIHVKDNLVLIFSFSALYLSLTAFSLNLIIHMSSMFSLISLTGMGLPSFVCIWTSLWKCSPTLLHPWARVSAPSKRKPVGPLAPGNWNVSGMHKHSIKQKQRWRLWLDLQSQKSRNATVARAYQKNSIWRLTSIMHLVTTWARFSALVRPTCTPSNP